MKCPQCDFEATKKFAIQRHINHIHTMFFFVCKDCKFSCKTETTFKKHIRKHVSLPSADDEKSLSGINSTLPKDLGESQVKEYMAVMEDLEAVMEETNVNSGEKILLAPGDLVVKKLLSTNVIMKQSEPIDLSTTGIQSLSSTTDLPLDTISLVTQYTVTSQTAQRSDVNDVDRFINKTPHKRKLCDDNPVIESNIHNVDGREAELQGIDYKSVNAGVSNALISPTCKSIILSVSNNSNNLVDACTDSSVSQLTLSSNTPFMCDDLSLLPNVDIVMDTGINKDLYGSKFDYVSNISLLKDTRKQDIPSDTSTLMEPCSFFRDNVSDSMFDMNLMRNMYSISPSTIPTGILGSEVLGTDTTETYNMDIGIQDSVDQFAPESPTFMWSDSSKLLPSNNT